MVSDKIYFDKANELVKAYETRDSFIIAEGLGIKIVALQCTGELTGRFCRLKDEKFIAINNNLNDQTLRVILAHEIKHFLFDEPVSISEFTNYGNKYQVMTDDKNAELFAACLLLDGEDIYDYAFVQGYTFSQISKIMCVDEKYVEMRFEMMKKYESDKFKNL